MISNEDKVKMFSMRLEGATFQEIADKFGISRQRVQQLLCSNRPSTRKTLNKIVYPNIAKWLDDNGMNIYCFGERCGLSSTSLRNFLLLDLGCTKYTIDKILEVTGLTYEEAFRKEVKK